MCARSSSCDFWLLNLRISEDTHGRHHTGLGGSGMGLHLYAHLEKQQIAMTFWIMTDVHWLPYVWVLFWALLCCSFFFLFKPSGICIFFTKLTLDVTYFEVLRYRFALLCTKASLPSSASGTVQEWVEKKGPELWFTWWMHRNVHQN